MNIKKNPFYYINTVIFLILTVYSLLVCIRVFDADNIDMNAGLCAVIVSMVLCLIMYLLHVTGARNMLYANPILKTSLEVISVLIFLTLSCVLRVYMMGEFELDITREGVVLLGMFMAYLTARMLNQFGFITLALLVPWPYLINTYNYDMTQLIQMAAVIAGICFLSIILFAVRKKPGLRLTVTVLFLLAVMAYFYYEMYQAGITSAYFADYKKYIESFNKMFEFTQFEQYYYIALVMAAIISGIRLILGAGSADTLILFVVNALCFFTIIFKLGPMYLNYMYPLLAMAAAGALGTRPAYMDEEVQLKDNLETVPVKYNKKDVVSLSYVDDSELDRMLADIEGSQKYSAHKRYSTAQHEESESGNDEIPIELLSYDSASSRPDEEKTDTVPPPPQVTPPPVYEPVQPTSQQVTPPSVYEPVQSPPPQVTAPPMYEPVQPSSPPVAAPPQVTPPPMYEPVAPAPPPVAVPPVYEPIEEPRQTVPSYEPEYRYGEEKPVYEPEYHYEEEKPVYEPEYRYEEEKTSYEPEYHYEEETITEPEQVSFYQPEPAAEPVIQEEQKTEPIASSPVYETIIPTAEQVVPTPVYEPEYHYEEEKPAYEQEGVKMEEAVQQVPLYEPEYHYEEETPSYEPEYHYEEETPSYEPEYHYEEEKSAYGQEGVITEEAVQQIPLYEPEPMAEPEPVPKEEQAAEPVPEKEPIYETPVQMKTQNTEPHLLIENLVSLDGGKIDETASQKNTENGFDGNKPMFETMASFFSSNAGLDKAPKFEMSQQDAQSFGAYSEADELYTPINSSNESTANADAGQNAKDVENAGQGVKEPRQEEKSYNEDDELVEEPVSIHQDKAEKLFELNTGKQQPISQPITVEPENIDLGLDLGEEFSFGQTVSFTDFYDTDSTSVFGGFEEAEEVQEISAPEFTSAVQKPETAVEMTVPVMETPVMQKPVIQTPVMETPIVQTPVMGAPVMEAPVIQTPIMEAPIMETPAAEAPVFEDNRSVNKEMYTEALGSAAVVESPYESAVQENAVNMPTAQVPMPETAYAEPAAEPKAQEKEPVKTVNPFAKEADFFDWSTYDGSAVDEIEPVVEETPVEQVQPKTDNDFEEFVWTEEMVKQFAGGTNQEVQEVIAEIEEAVPEVIRKPVPEVIKEIAATTVPETVFEPFKPVPEVIAEAAAPEKAVMEKIAQAETAEEEEPSQYQVYRPSGSYKAEEPVEEEETPQYQVYQSTGSFKMEEPVEEEEAPQYQVYQSTGNFQLEEPEEEAAPILRTYGEPEPVKPVETKPVSGNRYGDFEFDLDLPDFEPFDATKR